MHVVADVHCLVCAAYVGWAYLYAAELGQRYKQGKAVLERACLRRAGGESAGSDDEPDA